MFPNRKLFAFSFAVLIALSTLFYHRTQASEIVEYTFTVDTTMDLPVFFYWQNSPNHIHLAQHPFCRKSIISFMSYLLINYNYITTFLLVERVK